VWFYFEETALGEHKQIIASLHNEFCGNLTFQQPLLGLLRTPTRVTELRMPVLSKIFLNLGYN
jgi:hypothetical protein